MELSETHVKKQATSDLPVLYMKWPASDSVWRIANDPVVWKEVQEYITEVKVTCR